MRLNPDCVRAILFAVEENTAYGKVFYYPNEYAQLSCFTQDEVKYHIKQCELAGYLVNVEWSISSHCSIGDLHPLGHEFLANIRKEENWEKTKSIAQKVGSYSLSSLKDIAAKVIAELIKIQVV